MKWQGVVAVYFVLILFILSFAQAEPTVWYVHPDSTLNSIQVALDSCADNDIVLVAPGTYYENIVWPNTYGIQCISAQGAEMTIVDGSQYTNDTACVFGFFDSQDTCTILRGFTIQNGIGFNDPYWGACGGGIYCYYSSPTIMDNIVQTNTANWAGGIECLYRSYPHIINNKIISNIAYQGGGGIECAFISSPLIIGNIICQNDAPGGGGISCDSLCQAIIKYCTITSNTAASWGGGIGIFNNAQPTIDSCTISGNSIHGIYSHASEPKIHCNNIFDNELYGILNASVLTIDAENNWWGDATGPFHPDSNPGGLGDTVSDFVDFIPWLGGPVGIELPDDGEQKAKISVKINAYPNPFSERVAISLDGVSEYRGTGVSEIQIIDITGRVVSRLSCPLPHAPGAMQVTWDGKDHAGKPAPPGVYFLKAGGKPAGKVVKVR
jgi:parallel beta-helix repeat protein